MLAPQSLAFERTQQKLRAFEPASWSMTMPASGKAGRSIELLDDRLGSSAADQLESLNDRYPPSCRRSTILARLHPHGVRRAKAALSSGCKPRPATLQPEATGAGMEVTKCLKRASSEGWLDQQEVDLPGQ